MPSNTHQATIEPILLTTVRIGTFDGEKPMTNASGFFFERDERLYLVTNRHVVFDEPSDHHPSRIEIELHVASDNIAASNQFSIPLYLDGKSIWREGTDGGGIVDMVTIEIKRDALPSDMVFHAFTPDHLAANYERVEVGSSLLLVGFPLGFHDLLHHLPVVRQAIIASSFGMRFQGQGIFLTDARTHRGLSGAPVVMRMSGDAAKGRDLPWMLLGVHSSRFDVDGRDLEQDEGLSLNAAWYADMLLTLTGDDELRPPVMPREATPPVAAGNAANAAPPNKPPAPAPAAPALAPGAGPVAPTPGAAASKA
jgi:hypothetical protein